LRNSNGIIGAKLEPRMGFNLNSPGWNPGKYDTTHVRTPEEFNYLRFQCLIGSLNTKCSCR